LHEPTLIWLYQQILYKTEKSLKGENALAYKCVASKRFIKLTTDENPEMIKEQTGVREYGPLPLLLLLKRW